MLDLIKVDFNNMQDTADKDDTSVVIEDGAMSIRQGRKIKWLIRAINFVL